MHLAQGKLKTKNKIVNKGMINSVGRHFFTKPITYANPHIRMSYQGRTQLKPDNLK